MLALENNTPFAAHYVLLPNIQGIDTLYINVKASFNLGKNWTLCDKQPEPLYEDTYWGIPGQSSLKLPTDIHQGKPSTDIAILGSACAPNNNPVRQIDVSATVGSNQKTLRIFGDRFWRKGYISLADEFTRIPIRYENAFGGQYWVNQKRVSMEPRNPFGKGYQGARKPEEMEGQALPNIEDPTHLIRHMSDAPTPAGLGFIAPNWHPRAPLSGTYDEQWQQNRAPYFPHDYQPRFQHSAHPDLISKHYLTGGEAVTLTNMHPTDSVHFYLPHISLAGQVHFSRQPKQPLTFLMETLVIDIDAKQLTMVWKASCLCNNALPLLQALRIHLLR